MSEYTYSKLADAHIRRENKHLRNKGGFIIESATIIIFIAALILAGFYIAGYAVTIFVHVIVKSLLRK